MQKPTCGVLYKETADQFGQTPETVDAFAAGHVSGQAEKVYLGACKAAMFRPQPDRHAWLLEVVQAIAGRYGLQVQCLTYMDGGEIRNEIWISRQGVGKWLDYPVNSQQWHTLRGLVCGVPLGEIDGLFHLRPGYGQPCDGEAA